MIMRLAKSNIMIFQNTGAIHKRNMRINMNFIIFLGYLMNHPAIIAR